MISLFFDTETTGVKTKENPDFHIDIVQLGAILQDVDTGGVLHEVNLIVKLGEGVKNHPKAYETHHISEETTHKYGADPRLADVMFAFMVGKADVVVGHNLDFDLDVVKENLPESHKRIQGKQQFCTMENNINIIKAPFSDKQKWYYTSKGIKPDSKYKRPSLMETYVFYFGRQFEGAHDAMSDIRASRDVFMEMLKQELISREYSLIRPVEQNIAKATAKNSQIPMPLEVQRA